MGVPVASMLNMQGLAETYGITYDPVSEATRPDATNINESNAYFSIRYNFVIPVVALVVTVLVAVLFSVLRVKNKTEVKQNERNHILRGR